MINTIVVTLGNLAESLMDSAKHIIGSSHTVHPFCLEWNETPEAIKKRLEKMIHDVDSGAGVLLLTDMFGGSSTNVALEFQEANRVEVVTGVNLPMVVRAVTMPHGLTVTEAASKLSDQGRRSINIANERL